MNTWKILIKQFTFIDYYVDRFGTYPDDDYLLEIAKIISWNIWQMDGLKFVIPDSCNPVLKMQISLFDNEVVSEKCVGCGKCAVACPASIISVVQNS